MSINTERILELLGTTPKQKLETLRRQESFPVCAEESANDLLNADLFGGRKAPVKKVSAKESASRVVKRVPLNASAKKKFVSKEEEEGATVDASTDDSMVYNDVVTADGEVLAAFDYDSMKMPTEVLDGVTKALEAGDLSLSSVDVDDGAADEAVAIEACRRSSRECIHTDATETIIEAGEGKFPEELTFDEQGFAEEYGIDATVLSCIYVEEDTDAKVAEHIEISFDYDGSKVLLSITADGVVSETVDGEEIAPAQFTASIGQEEQEDGTMLDVLRLELLDDEDEGTIKSEEDSLAKSEGDEEHIDEDDKGPTDEFVEEAGLNLDPFYSKRHNMKLADKGAHTVQSGARESLAAKIVRTLG